MTIKKSKRSVIKTKRTSRKPPKGKNKEKDTQQFILVLIIGALLLAFFIYLMNK